MSNFDADQLSKNRLVSMDNFDEWFRLRLENVTASDAASLARESSLDGAVRKKLGSSFYGNRFTAHGNDREPVIAEWVRQEFGVDSNRFVFREGSGKRHLATPDGVSVVDGEVVLAEIKTTNKPFKTIPRNYLRQVWWQQYVLGATKTVFVWEEHKNFIPVSSPQFLWIERDEAEVKKLVFLADLMLERLDEARQSSEQPRSDDGYDFLPPF